MGTETEEFPPVEKVDEPVWITIVRLLLEERFVKTEYIAAILIDYYGHGHVRVSYLLGLPPGTTNFPPIDNEMVLVTWLVHEWLSEYNDGEFIQLGTGAWGKSASDTEGIAEALIEAEADALALGETPYFRKKLSNGELIIIDGEIFSTTDWVERYINSSEELKHHEEQQMTKFQDYAVRKALGSLGRRGRDFLEYIDENESFSTSDWELLNKRWENNNLGKVSQARISQMTTELIDYEMIYCINPPEKGKSKYRHMIMNEDFARFWRRPNTISHSNTNSRWNENDFLTVTKMREEGKTIAEIALMLERTESSVWAKLKRERKAEHNRLETSIRLKKWRNKKSKELDIAAYRIFDDKTKEYIVEARPTSLDELLSVKGIGWDTAKNYGKEILELVNYLNEAFISDIDERIKSIEDIILNCLIFPKGGPPFNPKDWDKLSEEERYRLLESRGARKKEIKEKMKFNKLNCIDKIIMGVLKDEYILYDLDKVYGTAQKYEVISAGEKQDKIFAVREITEKGREITEKGSMLGNMGYQCDNKTCNHRVQANFLASVKCPKCGETSLQKV